MRQILASAKPYVLQLFNFIGQLLTLFLTILKTIVTYAIGSTAIVVLFAILTFLLVCIAPFITLVVFYNMRKNNGKIDFKIAKHERNKPRRKVAKLDVTSV